MKKLKVFVKKECPNCPPAKELAKEIKKEKKVLVEIYSIDNPDGLAEAQFYGILATPTLVLCGEDENEIASFRGKAPSKKEIYEKL